MSDPFVPTSDDPGTILVVDDNPTNRELLAAGLAEHPFALTFAATGPEALARCQERTFDGLLMDVNLPGMSGIEACRRIKASGRNAHTPLIFLSASNTAEASLVEGLGAGGMDYLTWPYSSAELLAKLGMMVRYARQSRALLATSRERTLVAVVGGALRELNQPLASARGLLGRWRGRAQPPGPDELAQLESLLDRVDGVDGVLYQFRELKQYIAPEEGMEGEPRP